MENAASITAIPVTAGAGDRKKKRQSFTLMRAAMSIIRRRSNEKQKAKTAAEAKPPQPSVSQDVLKKIVGSMRPLHLPEDIPSPVHPDNTKPPSPNRPSSASSSSSSGESSTIYGSATNLQQLENGGGGGGDRSRCASCPNFLELEEGAGEGMRYQNQLSSSRNLQGLRKNLMPPFASAMNLLQLGGESDGESDEVDDEQEEKVDENAGDEMIDAKAEEFIAQFYSRMKLQRY